MTTTITATSTMYMGMKVVTVEGTFTPPTGLPSGISAILAASPTVYLQSYDSGTGTWNNTGANGAMTFVATNQYTYTFSPVAATPTYRGYVYASWALTGTIADNNPSNGV